MNPRPDIHSITGAGSLLETTEPDGRKIFRVRQSSETPSTWKTTCQCPITGMRVSAMYAELHARSAECGGVERIPKTVNLFRRREAQFPDRRLCKRYSCDEMEGIRKAH